MFKCCTIPGSKQQLAAPQVNPFIADVLTWHCYKTGNTQVRLKTPIMDLFNLHRCVSEKALPGALTWTLVSQILDLAWFLLYLGYCVKMHINKPGYSYRFNIWLLNHDGSCSCDVRCIHHNCCINFWNWRKKIDAAYRGLIVIKCHHDEVRSSSFCGHVCFVHRRRLSEPKKRPLDVPMILSEFSKEQNCVSQNQKPNWEHSKCKHAQY